MQLPHQALFAKVVRIRSLILKLGFVSFLLVQALTFGVEAPKVEHSCYMTMVRLGTQRSLYSEAEGAAQFKGYDSDITNVYAWEKEGLYYSEIEPLFNRLSPKGKEGLEKRFNLELEGKKSPALNRWLKNFAHEGRSTLAPTPTELKDKTPREILDLLLASENPLSLMSVEGAEKLFGDGVLSFDWVLPNPEVADWIALSDDLGSYEVKSNGGVPDRDAFHKSRNFIERFFEGDHIGHEHLIHGWPKDPAFRKAVSGRYVELIDASTWYLYFRSLKKSPVDETNPEKRKTILDHPYLGVHNRAALDRVRRAFEEGNPKKANNKFRLLGMRNFKANPKLPGQQEGTFVASLETRAGINKNDRGRAFFEDMLEARIVSGDYSGLKDFNDSDFDASTPLDTLVSKHLTPNELKALKEFEQTFPKLAFNEHGRAYNHYRNKIIAPLLPWEKRIAIDQKVERLHDAQKRYAQALVGTAHHYKRWLADAHNPTAIGKAREKALNEIADAAFRFARHMDLDEDFYQYLKPVPKESDLPDIRFKPIENAATQKNKFENGYRIDVNKIDLGIEYSFRFPYKPRSKKTVIKFLKNAAEKLRDSFGGGTVQQVSDGGHGHGLSVRFIVTDPQGREWRVEWDGIARTYNENREPVRARSGHNEIPTPRFSPQDSKEITQLYSAMRELGQYAKRHAGGAHVNFDLSGILKLGPVTGAKMIRNFINLFESEREMVGFLWQHPFRKRVAIEADVEPAFFEALNSFKGDKTELGKLLYVYEYFNRMVSRKPVYMQNNMAALLKELVPEEYRKSIDIKRPGTRWFPSFDKKGEKGELRLMDAMPDELQSTLQIKYVRALFNKAFNGNETIKYERRYQPEIDRKLWLEDEDAFMEAAKAHLESLGLDFNEFLPIVLQARDVQQATPKRKPLFKIANIKPGKDPKTGKPLITMRKRKKTEEEWIDIDYPEPDQGN